MKKIVLFGDSLAAGVYEGAPSAILDDFVIETLTGMGFSGYTVINMGQRGEDSTAALARLDAVAAENPDFVVLIIGDNDALNQRGLETFGANLQAMIARFPAEKVIVVTPTYIDPAIREKADLAVIEKYVQKAAETAKEQGAWHINMYHHMTVYPAVRDFLQADGLHPSKEGYHLLGALIARDIKNRLVG